MTRPSQDHPVSMQRLNNLFDGILAIAMTILVLNIDTPQFVGKVSSSDLWLALTGKSHVFFNYFLSFYILGSIWVSQVHQARKVARTKHRYLWLNLLALMFVCLVPFTTDMAGDYPAVPTAKFIFHGNLFMVGFLYFIEGVMVRRDVVLLHKNVTPEELRRNEKLSMLLPLAALGGILATFFSPDWSSLAYAAIPIMHPLLVRIK